MSMNDTPKSERIHIAFFGRRNAGKSSVINAFTGQPISLVSDVRGTTTDPVYKAMEILPLGPCMLIDTAGIDDEGELGKLRVEKSLSVLPKTDIAVLVVDDTAGVQQEDQWLTDEFERRELPFVIVRNKCDLTGHTEAAGKHEICVSAKDGTNILALREKIAQLTVRETHGAPLLSDLVQEGDLVVLVVPIDKAAPKGRLILPQQQVIRACLEAGAIAVTCKDSELEALLGRIPAPRMVITDAQAYNTVAPVVDKRIPLTSFSILFARYKGDLVTTVRGAAALDTLKAGDKVLISEGCTHHRQCDDIGTVKIPKLLQKYTGCELNFEWSSGTAFPQDLSGYKLVVHCGGCMLPPREMQLRQQQAGTQSVPITNYGIIMAKCRGILPRCLELFPEALAAMDAQA